MGRTTSQSKAPGQSDTATSASTSRRQAPVIAMLIAMAVITVAVTATIGRYPIDAGTLLRVLASTVLPINKTWPPTTETVIFAVRLPRIGVAMLIGAALSVSGANYQGVFRNPLVSPFILGASAGAGFGAAFAILMGGGALAIQLSAFGFAALAVVAAISLSHTYSSNSTLMLILSGIIVGGLFTALLALLKYTADPNEELPVITYWLLGSLSAARMNVLIGLALITIPVLALVIALRWRLNLLAFGDEAAHSLGVNVRRERVIHIGLATILASAAVSVCGIIGWVGLVVPHLARLIVGPDHLRLIPTTMILGAIFLLIVDTLARSLTAAEIPLGIITALVGAPVFAILLRRGERSWM